MSGFETVLVDVDGGVATVTLNRPEQRNAIDLRMEQELHDAMWGLETDDAVRAIVVTGAGKGFCSGVDISDPAAFGSSAHEEHDRELGVSSDTVGERVAYWRMDTPVIGAINGAAIGAGLTIALLFDMRIVAEEAKLSFVFTRRGILPEANSTWLLPRLVGLERALDLLLTGRTFTGAEAVEMGLAARALPAADVLPAARELARDLAVNTAPASVATAKRLVYENLGVTDRLDSMARETRLTWWLGEHPDALEGVMAYMEKREPKWGASKHLRPPEDSSGVMARELVLPHTLAARAERDPDHLLFQEVTGRELSYGDVHETVLTWADAIRRQGVGTGDTVATMTPNGFESYFAWLGISWLPALEVPINTMNRGQMLEYQLNNCRARVLVFAEQFLDQLADISGALEHAEVVVVPDLTGDPPPLPQRVVGPDELFAGASPARDLEGPEHWDTACIVYTSGTTGPSKGVLVPWAELYQFAAAIPDGTLDADGANYACLPTFHVGGKATMYISVLAGARTVLREVFSVSEFMNDVRKFNCTTTGLIGIMAQLLAATPEQPDDADNPLRFINTAPLWPAIDDFERRFGVSVYTGYGMTEIGAPLFVVDRVDWRSCGRARPGYELRIVDDHDEEVPHGVIGELIVRTDEPWHLNAGYFEMPAATATAWRNGWFHTGDGFRRDADGNFYFVDRLKDAMRRKGENISSLEVEGYVREHPGVLEVAAIAAPSDFGAGEDEVKLCVVAKPETELEPRELLEFLEPRMPRFMHPRYVEIVTELPKTPTARIRKIELRDEALNPQTWDRDRGAYVIEAGDDDRL